MKKLIATAVGAATAVAAAGIGLALMHPAGATAKPTRAAIASLAAKQVGKGCSTYVAGGNCDPSEWWCADFAEWVWRHAGVSPVPTTATARDVGQWAVDHGYFKERPSGQEGKPAVGDIVVFGAPADIGGGHVAIVYSVNSNGTITTINGDYGSGSLPSQNRVVRDTIDPKTARSGHDDLLISGYVTPPNVAPPAPPKPKSTPPTGSIYSLTHSGPGVWQVHGWAADPDHKTTAIQVRVKVNNRTKIVRANNNQPDVAKHKPGYGPDHGFNFSFGVPSSPIRSHAEIDALDPVTHTWTRISHTWTLSGGQPVGHFESATRHGNQVTVKGWAIDPNLHGPSAVLIKIGHNSTRLHANTNRPDIAKIFPHYGASHGYNDTFGIPHSATQVCITNLNSGPGTPGTTTCRHL
jgi:hypothetical protein